MIIKKIMSTSFYIRIILIMVVLILFGAGFYTIYEINEYKQANEMKYIPLDPKDDYIIQWKDSVLETKIRENIGKKEGDIYLSDIWDVNNLFFRRPIGDDGPVGETIKNIDNLKGLKNLRELFLDYNEVTDINAIGSMDHLEYLSLNGNHIQNLYEIQSLSHLQYLDLSNTLIRGEDLKYVSGIKNLASLLLNYNKIKSLENLTNLNLYMLQVRENQITDLQPLINNKHLFYLDLGENQIQDIGSLYKLKNLTFVWLDNNNINDISPLKR